MNVRTETCGSLSPVEVEQTFTILFDGFTGHARVNRRSERARRYRNALVVAQEWHILMGTGGLNQADLARKMYMSRARVTQVLRLLDLDPKSAATVVALGDPLPRQVITERAFRPLIDLPVDEQRTRVAQLVRRAKEQLRSAIRKKRSSSLSKIGASNPRWALTT